MLRIAQGIFVTAHSRRNDGGEIRLLPIDGVAPTREHIADGSYPLVTDIYAVSVSGDGRNTNPNLKALRDWILSDEGQTLIERTGYTPLINAVESK